MAELKTKKTNADVLSFLKRVEPEGRRNDALELKRIFDKATGRKAAMWGDGMVGYGAYHYRSERSSQQGDWPLTGFSPRKRNISVYLMPGARRYGGLLAKLGKHKVSAGSCVYINKLADVDTQVLEKIIAASVRDMEKEFDVIE